MTPRLLRLRPLPASPTSRSDNPVADRPEGSSSTRQTGRSRISLTLLGLAALAATAAGCESYPQDSYQEYIVVEAYLKEGEPLPEIRLSRTGEADRAYTFEERAVSDAEVAVKVLAEAGGGIERTVAYTLASQGVFTPAGAPVTVQAGRTYELEARVAGRSGVVRGRTTVPDSIRVVGEIPASLVYQSEQQLDIRVAVRRPVDRQNVFVFSTLSLDTLEQNLTPFYRAQYEDSDVTLSELAKTNSGTLNEGNFTQNDDGTYTLSFPWIGISFYGRNRIVTSVIDENLHDLVRSQSVQLGGSTLSPGEIQNVIYRLDGAIGIFGSLSSDTLETVIDAPPLQF